MTDDARFRTVRNPGTLALLDPIEAPVRGWLLDALAATDETLQRRRGSTHRSLTEPLAVSVGLTGEHLDRCGAVLDLTQAMIDLADNLADRDADRARGLDPLALCASVPPAVLPCLPSLFAACAMRALATGFALPLRGAAASLRYTTVLGRMVAGQGADDDSDARVDLASGMQALLCCLPLWLVFDGSADHDARLAATEHWALRYGRTWELREAYENAPDDRAALDRYVGACDDARAAWPAWGPFLHDGALAPRRLLP